AGVSMASALGRMPLSSDGLVTMMPAFCDGAFSSTATVNREDEITLAAIGSIVPIRTMAPGAKPEPEIRMLADLSFLIWARFTPETTGAVAEGCVWVKATPIARFCRATTDC